MEGESGGEGVEGEGVGRLAPGPCVGVTDSVGRDVPCSVMRSGFKRGGKRFEHRSD